MSQRPIWRALLLGTICFLVVVPFFWRGLPSGHDFEFHMFSWMEVLRQWKLGIVYPHWASLAHWGFGEARFVFYPPASWTLGAALGALLPWPIVPGVFIWIVLWLAGLSMYHLAKRWLPGRDALFAAAFYAVNPYHLLIVYWRSAYAELLAAIWLPFLLRFVLELENPGSRATLLLAMTLAAGWLTNAPAAVMIYYSAAALALVIALMDRSWRPLWRTMLAIVLGTALAAFYLVPAAYEQKWVNINEVLSPGVRPIDNFLFTTISDADHNRFNRLVSIVAAGELGALILAIAASRYWRKLNRRFWVMLSVWGGIAGLVMFSFTDIFWERLPELRFVQLPWRWLLCLNAALALLLAISVRRWILRALAGAALVGVVVLAGYSTQPPWWDHAADIREMSSAMSSGAGYEGTDEYVPAGADPYELKKDEPRVSSDSGAPISVKITKWQPTEKDFTARVREPGNLKLRLFNYPAWEVRVNGGPVETETTDVTGQMLIPIQSGNSDVQIRLHRTRDQTVGVIISVVGLLALLVSWILTRPIKLQSASA